MSARRRQSAGALRWLLILVAASAVAAGAITFRRASDRSLATQLAVEAEAALTEGRIAQARDLSERALYLLPTLRAARYVAGQTAFQQQELEIAVRHLETLAEGEDRYATDALCLLGNAALQAGDLESAERRFRRAQGIANKHSAANNGLAYVLLITGRRSEALPLLGELIQGDHFSGQHLFVLASERIFFEFPEFALFRQRQPDHRWVQLVDTQLAFQKHNTAAAKAACDQLLLQPMPPRQAYAWRGRLHLEQADYGSLTRWQSSLPKEAWQESHVWAVAGFRAVHQQEHASAARCFWEAIRRDPNHRASIYQLSQLVEDTNVAARLATRARHLDQLEVSLQALFGQSGDLVLLQRVSDLTEAMGRIAESVAWAGIAIRIDPTCAWATERLARDANEESLPLFAKGQDPADWLDRADAPLPTTSGPATVVESRAESTLPAIHFRDDAAAAGIVFTFHNAEDPATEGKRMFEYTGGGVGVIDMDGDGRPDLYLSQGAQWPPDSDDGIHLDQLYRNRGDSTFESVTRQARIHEPGYSQGISVGDLDHDGFADLYVAAIGVNRLFHNQGDGTFVEVVDPSFQQHAWTTSCAMADLNGDGAPDLYDVNYLTGPDIYSRVCERDGIGRACHPNSFQGQQDRLLLSRGDGTWFDATSSSGVVRPDGTGLGIVVADFASIGALDLFVANDAKANFHFSRTPSVDSDVFQLDERAALSGLSADRDGMAQACMGVAAGDANQDGRLDLFVTNYYNESNTFYEQQERGYFVDATPLAGLRKPGFQLLGFGCQFLDADLDGALDLVLVNGHVDDFSIIDQPYRMTPLFLWNEGKGTFRSLDPVVAGDFFAKQALGRSLARLDWNGDGADDFAVSHLDGPAALLTNVSADRGHFLGVRLVGVGSCRDPVGARVLVECDDQQWTKQLTAGDGYMASNERCLRFGLGARDHVDRLTVTWPSGQVDEYHNLRADQTLLIREGDSPLVYPLVP